MRRLLPLLLIAMLLCGCAPAAQTPVFTATTAATTPSPTAVPSPTPAPSPTATPSPTPSPSPTLTPSPAPTPVDVFSLTILPPENPNAARPLEIPTYDGKGQTTHPKVLYFPEKWQGWRYWMVHTPYPGCHNKVENPSIVVSQDGIHWTEPEGLVNPVSGLPPTFQNSAHYSDGHLLLREDTLELWFRHNGGQDPQRNADNDGAEILRITSQDGIHWTEPEVMLAKNGRKPYLSPIVMWEEGGYTMWYSAHDGRLYRRTSSDGKDWGPEEAADLAYPGYKVWHQDMISTDLGYEIVFCAKTDDGLRDNLQHQELFYAMSEDGLHFTEPVKILSYRDRGDALDNNSIYRASLVSTQEGYRLYYSAMNDRRQWHIFLSQGPSIAELTGYGAG